MNHTQQYVEDGLKGGWLKEETDKYGQPLEEIQVVITEYGGSIYASFYGMQWSIEQILMRPDFWQAVGKTRNWEEWSDTEERLNGSYENVQDYTYRVNMHRFVDFLIEGKSIEEGLGLIANG